MKYKYLRTGPTAGGWEMNTRLYAKCPMCGYYMSLNPAKTDNCPCRNLYKDSDAGRFGARTGDASIEIYEEEM